MQNKELRILFSKIYNDGNLLSNIVSDKDLNKLKAMYKKNFDKFQNFDDFEKAFPTEFEILKKSLAAYFEVKKQFNRRLALQPAILSECFMTQTIANVFNMTKFYDFDNPSTQIPQSITSVIFKFAGKRDNSTYRYIYADENSQNILIQCGSSTSIDVYFIKNFKAIRIEYKEKDSKLGEFDLTEGYNEDGKIIISDEFRNKNSKYVQFVELFNQKTDIFTEAGHNWPLFKYVTFESVKEILIETFLNKEIDLYCFLQDNKLLPILPKYLFECTTFNGSEIRTAGRNHTSPGKAFTYQYIRKLINDKHGTISNENIVTMPFSELKQEKGRGKDTISRYKLSSLVFVSANDKNLQIIDGITIKFPLKSILQLKPSISIHLHPKYDKDVLQKQMEELNNKK